MSSVAVLLGPGRDDRRVVEAAQLLRLDVHAVVDVADEPDPRVVQHPVQRVDDLLDPRVVGRHAIPDQAVGRRQPVEDVDGDRLRGLDQVIGGVDAGRAGTDDGNPQGAVHGRIPLLALSVRTAKIRQQS